MEYDNFWGNPQGRVFIFFNKPPFFLSTLPVFPPFLLDQPVTYILTLPIELKIYLLHRRKKNTITIILQLLGIGASQYNIQYS